MMSLITVIAIIAAITLGYRTKINIGLFAIAFAYLIGCFVMGLSPKAVVNMWPLKLFFIIFSVCLFYGFAIVNGTLERLSEHLLYRCRNFPHLLPYAIFLTSALIAAMGAGYYTVLAFMAPLTLLLCQRTGMSLIIGGMSVNYGALGGANFMSSQSGIIFRGLMTNNGIAEQAAFVNSFGIFASTMLIPLLVITLFVFMGNHRQSMQNGGFAIEAPQPFTKPQRQTLGLTLLMMVVVLLPPIAHLVAPDNEIIGFIDSKLHIGLIASVFSVIALLMKLADERKVMTSLPWNTIIMICGVGMLISVAIEAGTIDLLASWMKGNIPAVFVPLVIGLVAAAMSLFASTLGVVTPALFPIVPSLASSLSIDPMVMFICIVVGAQATSISPFSSGGSLILGSCPTDEARAGLFNKLLFRAAPIGLGAALLYNLALTFVM
ncbi:C4-dicarboxylate ABC transporter [Terasakiispira papahanaumokuakeensis]|uniref:C4-dicarboxylate ABC transporter n=1 Tax=Terasakiispira papahanaumokuakeensis TaxID=197479 RepID=A0A1E2V6Q1_9GAMM|nr:SLC13 family permease [Terasakiispira papahanaumokuakeensis]ODC02593.1 C4-dicarboxylate ABC transporter [Terasakiispira papahanaumokuakeensis]